MKEKSKKFIIGHWIKIESPADLIYRDGIRDYSNLENKDSKWEIIDCPYCGGHHINIVKLEDGFPLNYDGGCPKTNEGILGWNLIAYRARILDPDYKNV